ncbi:MAG: hypothetical protein RKE49_10180 [Oceanicaulis sp.]
MSSILSSCATKGVWHGDEGVWANFDKSMSNRALAETVHAE